MYMTSISGAKNSGRVLAGEIFVKGSEGEWSENVRKGELEDRM